jgi:dihydroflavonol-4-reductase
MHGCDVVYYCVVDARPWLRDPTPMWRTNVEGLRNVLEVASDAALHRFVVTSSIATIGLVKRGSADEETAHNWLDRGGDYIRTRVEGEQLMRDYCRDRGLPGVAMCVSNTYRPGDRLPTPHGGLRAHGVRRSCRAHPAAPWPIPHRVHRPYVARSSWASAAVQKGFCVSVKRAEAHKSSDMVS